MRERMTPMPRRANGRPISIPMRPMARPAERPSMKTAVVREANTRERGRARLAVSGGASWFLLVQINLSRSV